MRRLARFRFPLLAALLAAASPAFAQSLDTLLGLGVRSLPEYDGASKQEAELIPVIRYYDKILFARTTQGVLEGGARMNLTTGLAAGVQLAYEGGNDRTNVDPGASIGVHLEWDTFVGPAPVNVLGRIRYHLDSDLGAQADLRTTVGVYGDSKLLVGVYAQATWGTSEWVRSYYTTGSGGLLYMALGVEGGYNLSKEWVMLGSLHNRWLQGDAKDSPITEKKSNYYLSVGLAYRF